jgi:hypothetical protein
VYGLLVTLCLTTKNRCSVSPFLMSGGESMATRIAQDKVKYAMELYKNGVTAPAKIQQALKKKFGSGMNFRDLGKVFPKKSGAKKKTKRRDPGRPKKNARRRGRPVGSSSDQWLLLAGEEAEVFGSRRKLQERVAALLGEGTSPRDLAVYEKTSLKLTVKTSITL